MWYAPDASSILVAFTTAPHEANNVLLLCIMVLPGGLRVALTSRDVDPVSRYNGTYDARLVSGCADDLHPIFWA